MVGTLPNHYRITKALGSGGMGEVYAAEDPYACPHGRPVVLKMADADLERRFGRR